MDLFVIAGAVSTALFAIANLPMVVKAARTRDLGSYSLSNLALGNAANVVHSLYVFSLPVGPIWVLHSFYLASMAVMLVLYLRYAPRVASSSAAGAARGSSRRDGRSATAPASC